MDIVLNTVTLVYSEWGRWGLSLLCLPYLNKMKGDTMEKERGFWIINYHSTYILFFNKPKLTGGGFLVEEPYDRRLEKLTDLKCKEGEMFFIPTDKLKKIARLVKK